MTAGTVTPEPAHSVTSSQSNRPEDSQSPQPAATVPTVPEASPGPTQPAYKLCYFPFRGRGEFLRYILHYLGLSFVDNRVTFEQWAHVKPRTPFGSLPVLHVGEEKKLTQSFCIARYLAIEHGIAGDTVWEQALVDMYADGISDVMSALRPVCCAVIQQDNNDVPKLFATYREQTVLPFLDKYEAFLEQNGTGWLVRDKLTWVDILLAELLERYETCFDASILKNHPRARQLMLKVHDHPRIKYYLTRRPKMPF